MPLHFLSNAERERAARLLPELLRKMQVVATEQTDGEALDTLRELLDQVQGRTPSPVPKIVTPSERFAYVSPTPAQVTRMHILRSGFTMLTTTVEEACKPGRYLSLAYTALEEAAMWANKSVSHDP